MYDMHACSDKAVSIKTALKEAGEGHVGSFLALTDFIIGVIKCCPTSIARDQSEKAALDMVYYILYIHCCRQDV